MRLSGKLGSLPVRRCFHAPRLYPNPTGRPGRGRFGSPCRPQAQSSRGRGRTPWRGPARARRLPAAGSRVQPGVDGFHSHVSCWGMPSASAWSFCIPPNKTARLRWLSHTSAESYRALGALASVSWVQVPWLGSHSRCQQTPAQCRSVGRRSSNGQAVIVDGLGPEGGAAIGETSPKSSTLPVDFSNTMLCWLRAPGPEVVRSLNVPLEGSHSQVSW